ncbi:unnamed protein product [Effrenium voratum]|nr:unnamed protein product [Effrenium voratum]|eukprot:CAMPEP_0181411154 /NCGR_PEP_ID=MMETSP1110-20121109/7721_1 /TAXON_ID=174948 /ORGANISM="Symbiodinium sp., Strain CCMP421" /LENGTH=141 /DNA_ID=CAMNT_0023533749 /DNA_START=47 /DNA_END=472 /DNA_ORIENTATION=+
MRCAVAIVLWLPFSLAAQAKHAAQVSAAGETLNELARDIRQVESLLAEDSASEQPNFGPRNGMPMPPVQQSEAMRPIQQGAKMDEDLSFYYASLPLDAGLDLESDDGVWISSRRRATPPKDDQNYDTNYLLSIPLKIYESR